MTKLEEALFAYSIQRISQIRPDDRFAHYTGLDVAEKIIDAGPGERSLWLRNAQGMNDFSEVSHGLDCLDQTLSDWRPHGRFTRVLNAISFAMDYDIIVPMLESAVNLADQTFLTSLSLHDARDSLTGKLSMWRAYGGTENVCMIFQTQPFVTDQKAWELVLSPVLYGGPLEFKMQFETLTQRLERCAAVLSSLDPAIVLASISRSIDFSVLSTKHLGFHEEDEWRIIHRHSEHRPDRLRRRRPSGVRTRLSTIYPSRTTKRAGSGARRWRKCSIASSLVPFPIPSGSANAW